MDNTEAVIYNDTEITPGMIDSNHKNKVVAIKPKEEKKTMEVSSAIELLYKELPERQYIWENTMLQNGVYMLAGAPKIGKSWLALDLGIKVAQGKEFQGFKTTKSNVLYIDLETDEYGMKERITKIGGEFPENLYITYSCNPIGQGFEEQIREVVKNNNIDLIIVDVFVKIRSENKGKKDSYTHDYGDFNVLKQLRDELNVCFILVTHVTKMKHDDDFNRIMGSVAQTGANDGAFALIKEDRTSDKACIKMISRAVEGREWVVKWEKDTCTWEYVDDLETVRKNESKELFNSTPLVRYIEEELDNNKEFITSTQELLEGSLSLADSTTKSIQILSSSRAIGKFLNDKLYNFKQKGIEVITKRQSKGNIYIFKRN